MQSLKMQGCEHKDCQLACARKLDALATSLERVEHIIACNESIENQMNESIGNRMSVAEDRMLVTAQKLDKLATCLERIEHSITAGNTREDMHAPGKRSKFEDRMSAADQKLDALATNFATHLASLVGNHVKINENMSRLQCHQNLASVSLSRIEERVMTSRQHSLITLTVANSDSGSGTVAGAK